MIIGTKRISKRLVLVLVPVLLLLGAVTVAYAADGLPFTDIAGHWAQDAIVRVFERGTMAGHEDGTFGPDENVTRAQLATILDRLQQGGTSGGTPAVADGIILKITNVTIDPADNRPIVRFTLTNSKKQPLDIAQADANGVRFAIGKITAGGDQYVSYIVSKVAGANYTMAGQTKTPALAQADQPGLDSGGDTTKVKTGEYTYKMKTALPADFDKTVTHAVVGTATANARASVSNDAYYFVPNGAAVATTRQVVATENCNQCHDPLAAHGGSRQDPRVCVLCHTPQNVDPETGNTLDFKVMVHKIHRSANLPSVVAGTPYFIVGHSQTVADFSDIAFPQDIRNCTTCHGAPAGMSAADYAKLAPNANRYKTAPSRAACGACHDQIDWTTGKSTIAGKPDHQGGPQTSDASCAGCHQADSGNEFDASVVGAHVIPANSKQLKGVKLTLIAASFKAGEKPSVDFSIKDNAGGSLDPNTLNRVSIAYAYPTTDYASSTSEAVNTIPAPGGAAFVRAGTLTDLGGGTWRYVFSKAIDAGWTKGSVGIGLQASLNTTIKGPYGKDTVVPESTTNPIMYASLDGSNPVARRTVVNLDKCNSCHKDIGGPDGISIHGGQRRNTQYCIICHNPKLTNAPTDAADPTTAQSMQFKNLIHTIHMGAARAVPTVIAGINTAEVRYPGNQADCLKCHEDGTYGLPLPSGALPATLTVGGAVAKVIPPITASCNGCHAGQDGYAAHVASNTAGTDEACSSCHGAGKAFDVVAVHSAKQ